MSSTSSESPAPTPSFVLKNVTIDDADSSLEFSQGWNRIESSSAHGGSFQTSNTFNVTASFSLPERAVVLYYFGFKQASGGFYGACLDCSSLNVLETIDAHDDTPPDAPAVLYKRNLDPDVRHSLIVVNANDPRFGDSTITLDSFVVTIQDETDARTDSDSPSASPTVQSSGTASPDAGSEPSAGERKLRMSAMIAGVLIAALLVFSTLLFALMYFRRRRKRRNTAPGKMFGEGHWATRFFGNGSGSGSGSGSGITERASVWLGRSRASSAAGLKGGAGDRGRTDKGHAGEKTLPDRQKSRSLSSPPTLSPPPVSASMQPREERKWVEPAYNSFSSPQISGSISRSTARSPFTPISSDQPSASPGRQAFTNDRPRLARVPSTNPSMRSASHGPPLATLTGPGLGPSRRPSASDIVSSYATETHSRMYDRGLGGTSVSINRNPYVNDSELMQFNGNGYPNAFLPSAPVSGYTQQFGSMPMPGPVYEYGYWYGSGDQGQNHGVIMHRNTPWGDHHFR